jgi:hydrogenase-1 operon protein HyaF
MAAMSPLDTIGIRVEPAARDDSARGNALAILHEIETLLTCFVERGETAMIDLRGIPMSTQDYKLLHSLLGEGEVAATLSAGGPSEIRETRYPGVWWIIHRDLDDAVVAELIEIAAIPSILTSPPEDIVTGLQQMRRSLEEIHDQEANVSASCHSRP